MFNKGLIIVNAYCVYASVEHQARRLVDEFNKLGVTIDIKENNFGACFISRGTIETNISGYDFVIYLDKDAYQAELIEKFGFPVFNNSTALANCDDKMRTNILLASKGIETPKTISAPFCARNVNDFDFSEVVRKTLNYPIMCKECYASFSAQPYLIKNDKELRLIEEKMIYKKHYYQEYLPSSRDVDYHILLINKKVVAAVNRHTDDQHKTSMNQNSFGDTICELPKQYVECAEKVAEYLDLDYCGVVLLIGDKSQPVVCDVDANAFFAGIENSSGLNIAKMYAEYIISRVYPTR